MNCLNNKYSGKWKKAVKIQPRSITGRMRLLARWFKYVLISLKAWYFDFAWNAFRAQIRLIWLSVRDIISKSKKVECNICGWKGFDFYPNVGWGYNEKSMLCPACDCLDRYRSLAAILWTYTSCFSPNSYVIEVGPSASFQQYCLAQKKNKNYVSFDIKRHAMEKGDITQMRYHDNTADYFLCFHVLEHIENDFQALSEIRRVLKPGGLAILQVPIDWCVEQTCEYSASNPRDVGHFRRYGRDFAQRVSSCGLKVSEVSVVDFVAEDEIEQFGFSKEPVFFAQKVT